jgi:hypothetical protein
MAITDSPRKKKERRADQPKWGVCLSFFTKNKLLFFSYFVFIFWCLSPIFVLFDLFVFCRVCEYVGIDILSFCWCACFFFLFVCLFVCLFAMSTSTEQEGKHETKRGTKVKRKIVRLGGLTLKEVKYALEPYYLILQLLDKGQPITSCLVNLKKAAKCGALTPAIWEFLAGSGGDSNLIDTPVPGYYVGIGWIKEIVFGVGESPPFVESMKDGCLAGKRVLQIHIHTDY